MSNDHSTGAVPVVDQLRKAAVRYVVREAHEVTPTVGAVLDHLASILHSWRLSPIVTIQAGPAVRLEPALVVVPIDSSENARLSRRLGHLVCPI